MRILGIETSCDETSASIVENGKKIISTIVSSQTDIHSKYGGVVPEIAARKHAELLLPIIDSAIKEANMNLSDIDAVAVTSEPGLIGALLVGVSAAKALAYSLKKTLIPVNHILAHLYSANLEFEIEYPVIGLIISGGHTLLVKSESYECFDILGSTLDDAVGESFDKVAKMLNIGYPGGPIIEKLAQTGSHEKIIFPKPMINEKNFNFSFSGLKTSVLYYIKNNEKNFIPNDVCASFQKSVFDVLLTKTLRAAEEFKISNIIVGGGVAANKTLKKLFETEFSKLGKKVYFPSIQLCTDNAAMVAGVSY
nr:tRNA (adenosine(37)-N6)-threonylcarbamoyltransferase complex transferase subunit TsaD [Candidatus Dependentiae bacterium]